MPNGAEAERAALIKYAMARRKVKATYEAWQVATQELHLAEVDLHFSQEKSSG